MRKGRTGPSQVRKSRLSLLTLRFLSWDKGDMRQWGMGQSGSEVTGPIGTHPTKSTKALQDLAVKEAGAGRVSQGLVQEVVDEINARLHSEHHSWLQVPSSTQAPQAGLINAHHALWGKEG